MTLELKHLKNYLGTGLKWTLLESGMFTMSGLTETTLYTEEGAVLSWPKYSDFPQVLFPAFLPLSALTEPEYTEVSDEFSEIEIEILFDHLNFARLGLIENDTVCNKLNFEGVQKLFANHFDVYGLIDAGLAIDKRTIK